MPNRVIKESIKCSEQIDALTWFQEVMFYRLMVTVDDFGRYYANPQIIKSELFPTKENLTKASVADGLDRLEELGLISRYEVDKKIYLMITKWEKHQQRRSKNSKFPGNDGCVKSCEITCNHVKSDDITCNQVKSHVTENRESRIENRGYEDARAEIEPEEALRLQSEHDEIFNAAQKAGFNVGDSMRDKLLELFVEYGKERLLYAINECVENGACKLTYLRAVLGRKNKKSQKTQTDDGDDWYNNLLC